MSDDVKSKWPDWIDPKIGLGSIITCGIAVVGFAVTAAVTLSTVADLKTTVQGLVTYSNSALLASSLQSKDIVIAQHDINSLRSDYNGQQASITSLNQRGVGWDDSILSLKEKYENLTNTHKK